MLRKNVQDVDAAHRQTGQGCIRSAGPHTEIGLDVRHDVIDEFGGEGPLGKTCVRHDHHHGDHLPLSEQIVQDGSCTADHRPTVVDVSASVKEI